MAILPHARPFKDDPPMARSRRSKPSRTWQVEQLEDRALLTTMYGPTPATAGLVVTPAPISSNAWWNLGPNEISTSDRGRFVISMAEPTNLALALRTKDLQQARSAFSPVMDTLSFGAGQTTFAIANSNTYSVIEGTKMGRLFGGSTDAPPPPFAFAIRGFPGAAFTGRGPMVFGRPRDDMDGGPPRLGSRSLLLVISPDSYWENGIIGKSNEAFSFASSGSPSEARSGSSAHTEPNSSETTGYGQSPATTSNLTNLLPGPSTGNVMIWVDADTWSSDTVLTSSLLSQREFEPGALFPQDDLPEVTALLASILNEWLDETVELPLPLSGQLQQITKLDPLDESSLALTATLLTVSSAPQSTTAGPSPSENASSEASLPASNPPSWAGFVIGLNEAFEANRLATHRWPSSTEPQSKSKQHDGASEAARTVEQAAADEALQSLDREPPPQDAIDALFLPPSEKEKDTLDSTAKEGRLSAAARASLSLAIVPALWAERLSHRRGQPDQDDRDED
ncbi:hypothetical protein [Singulisphaera acidiphila]|uniref:Uncharacterized protein n=1 Tax=Singulisphaera acidiphila (strain ATCC BAA-1392 / DSM 18658 / VKM B-2454 / MOB10) TaxID=886293 RepID=L0DRU0_SINAD|nr:hypothetical protein [Singulisphaera acidiphila]AGA31106.1 hypothetical protein Sinac_7051 [Singulisphaera acidiphila DSM 18658]